LAKRTVRFVVGCTACVGLFVLGVSPRLRAQDLTSAQRAELEKQSHDLNEQAVELFRQGKYAAAVERAEQALGMYQRLYPAGQDPGGRPPRAASLNNLGVLLQTRRESARAQVYYEQALAMRQGLYPADQYPDGHPHLATSLNNMGFLLQARGEYGRAQPY